MTKLDWEALAFFRSVIKSGEPWTDSCQRAYDKAMSGGRVVTPLEKAARNVLRYPNARTHLGSQIYDALEQALARPAPEPGSSSQPSFDILTHLARQAEWSARTFGPGRLLGVVDHISRELDEIREAPEDLEEWIDVVILALDGAWRTGAAPSEIVDALVAKQAKNEKRDWPDWRTLPKDVAIEHVKASDDGGERLSFRTADAIINAIGHLTNRVRRLKSRQPDEPVSVDAAVEAGRVAIERVREITQTPTPPRAAGCAGCRMGDPEMCTCERLARLDAVANAARRYHGRSGNRTLRAALARLDGEEGSDGKA